MATDKESLDKLIARITPENQHISERSPEPVDLWALVEQAAKLLEWCPVCSIGSSGYIRQENLRRTLKKFGKEVERVGESPAPAKEEK